MALAVDHLLAYTEHVSVIITDTSQRDIKHFYPYLLEHARFKIKLIFRTQKSASYRVHGPDLRY